MSITRTEDVRLPELSVDASAQDKRLLQALYDQFRDTNQRLWALETSLGTAPRKPTVSAVGGLTASYVGYGDSANTLTGTSDFTYVTASGALKVTKSVNALVSIEAINTRLGSLARGGLAAQNDNAEILRFSKYSTGSNVSGLIGPSAGVFENLAAGTFNIVQNVAADVYYAVAGNAAANVYAHVLGVDGSGSKVGNLGIGYGGVSNPQARLQLKAGTATAGTAPLLVEAGTNTTAAVSGQIENDGADLFYTDAGPTRRALLKQMTTQTLTDAATVAWNVALGPVAKVTLGGNRTLGAPSNLVDGGTYVLRVIQDGTGTRTLAYNAVFKWAGGVAPVLSIAVNAIDILTFVSDGTNLYGLVVQKAFA